MPFKWILTATLALAIPLSAGAEDKWTGSIPKVAEKPEDWAKLIPALLERNLPYGAMAASRAALNFFSDLPTKELAYRTIVRLVDAGYPFSTRADFVAGDLDLPAGNDPFNQSYFLYKGIVNLDKNMPKWAEYYFGKVDRESSPRYLFFRATEAYRAKKLPEAVELLKKGLALTRGPDQLTLAKIQARTLARIHYELGEFDRALDIYETFLLKTNPVTPTDWLESAWALYQLKRYPEALGRLYNLEGKLPGTTIALEKFVLRGLIHREFCATAASQALLKNFEATFGTIITGIKTGEPLAKYPQLLDLEHPEANAHRQYVRTIDELQRESKQTAALASSLRGLAGYVFESELAMLKRGRRYHEDRALTALARHLVIMDESLKFLKFDVAREKFSPDRVFAEIDPAERPRLVEDADDRNFRLHWLQWGDYWRDERSRLRALPRTKCAR